MSPREGTRGPRNTACVHWAALDVGGASGFSAISAAAEGNEGNMSDCPTHDAASPTAGAVREDGPEPEAVDPIDVILEEIDGISTIPQVALHIMQVAGDPEAGAADLNRVLEGDPALSARVLRCINSAAYALPKEVTNLQLAISYLGFDQIRNLAMTACVSDVFKREETVGAYRRSSLWKHLVLVGICARLIAMRQRLPNFEDAFLAGLLHDIGIILEDQHVHDRFVEVLLKAAESEPLRVVENEILGFDHTTLGARVSKAWSFPSNVRAAIRYHHGSEQCEHENRTLVQCVEVANYLCTVKGFSSVGAKLVGAPRLALRSLSLGKMDVTVLASDLDHEMSLNQHLFNM